mgnify:CR=1 FL=1
MPRELRINDIVGRMVYDVEGRKVGRIEEMLAVIELEEHGNDYVVAEYHVGAYGLLEAFTGSRFAQKMVQRLHPVVRYRRFRIPWDWMDLTNPERPTINRRRSDIDAVTDNS